MRDACRDDGPPSALRGRWLAGPGRLWSPQDRRIRQLFPAGLREPPGPVVKTAFGDPFTSACDPHFPADQCVQNSRPISRRSTEIRPPPKAAINAAPADQKVELNSALDWT